jgi:hypothetical protein
MRPGQKQYKHWVVIIFAHTIISTIASDFTRFIFQIHLGGQGLKATSNQGPRSRIQCNRAMLLDEKSKLNLQPLHEGSRPKTDKLRLNFIGHGRHFGAKTNWFKKRRKKKKKKGELVICAS